MTLVIQRLFATGMSLQAATGMMPAGPAAGRVRQSVDALDDTIHDIRTAIFSLQAHPGPGGPGLRAQIMAAADEMTEALGYPPSLRLDGGLDARVPPEVAEDLLKALREGLSNAARHARASQVDVSAEIDGDLLLVVQDNGTGITGTSRRSGPANLAERASAPGGEMTLQPAPGRGTRIQWHVPLPGA